MTIKAFQNMPVNKFKPKQQQQQPKKNSKTAKLR